MTASLSVVIPAHDTPDLTLRCVRALRLDGGSEIEIVVVDDGGSDQIQSALAQCDPAVRVLRNDVPRGFTAAANAGMSTAEGDLLFLLNSDTELLAGGIAAVREAFAGSPTLGIAGAQLLYPDRRPQWSAGPTPGPLWLFALASGFGAALHKLPGYRRLRPRRDDNDSVTWVSGAAMVVRRAAWKAAGPFDERYRFYAQDLDFCLRAAELGWLVRKLPRLQVLHHHGATIGRTPGAVAHQQPEILWTDLVRWAAKRGGPAAALSAARALRAGARCRLSLRALAGLPRFGTARRVWRVQSDAYRRALAALDSDAAVN